MKKIYAAINAWLPPIVWSGLIFFLSSQSVLPGFEETAWDYIFKKSAHMFVYAVLYALTWRAVRMQTHFKSTANHLLLPLILTMLYAASDELHQSTVVGRTATIRDVGYDFVGACTALILLRKYN
jgi:VanZ family protein